MVDRTWKIQSSGSVLPGASIYDFLTSNLKPLYDTWNISYRNKDDGAVEERFTLASQASASSIMDDVKTLRELSAKVDRSFAEYVPESIWYYVTNSSEFGYKRSLIHSLEIKAVPTNNYTPFVDTGAAFYEVKIIRDADWESDDARTTVPGYELSSLNVLGGKYLVSSYPEATLSSRVERIYITSASGINSIYKLWLGYAPQRFGKDDFVSMWHMEDASPLWSSSLVADYNAYPIGFDINCIKTSFSTASLAGLQGRAVRTLPSSSLMSTFTGKYLILCRNRVELISGCMSAKVGIQLRYGYTYDENATICDEVYVDETISSSYHLTPLGEITIPPAGYKGNISNYPSSLSSLAFAIFAEKVSGCCYLYTDELIAIPSEHYIYISGASMISACNSIGLSIIHDETGNLTAFSIGESGSIVKSDHTIISKDFGIPIGPKHLVVMAAERDGINVYTDALNLAFENIHPKFSQMSYRT